MGTLLFPKVKDKTDFNSEINNNLIKIMEDTV